MKCINDFWDIRTTHNDKEYMELLRFWYFPLERIDKELERAKIDSNTKFENAIYTTMFKSFYEYNWFILLMESNDTNDNEQVYLLIGNTFRYIWERDIEDKLNIFSLRT